MFDEKCMMIPRGTKFGERTIVALGDVVVADYSRVEYNLEVPGNLYVGENVRIDGDLDVSGEARIDGWSAISGDVKCGGDIFLGHSVKITGGLFAGSNLDVGEDVEIGDGFEAKGWITVRDPIPIVIYIFIYILQLIGIGKSDEVEKIVKELEEIKDEEIRVRRGYLYIPRWSRITRDGIKVRKGFKICAKSGCRLSGNCLGGRIELGDKTALMGSIRAESYVRIGAEGEVGGSIHAKGSVVLGNGVRIGGKISASRVEMSKSSAVEGRIRADEGIIFIPEEGEEGGIEQELFEKSIDLGKALE